MEWEGISSLMEALTSNRFYFSTVIYFFHLLKRIINNNKIKNVKNAKAEYKGPNDVNFSSLIRGVLHPAGR